MASYEKTKKITTHPPLPPKKATNPNNRKHKQPLLQEELNVESLMYSAFESRAHEKLLLVRNGCHSLTLKEF